MLSDIYKYNAETDDYRQRRSSNFWRVRVTETGDIRRIEAWYPPSIITRTSYGILQRSEKYALIKHIEAKDELEVFMKIRKMKVEK